nr:hypothetical protein 1 [Mute swan feces associated picorna-like virus 12]
MDTYETTDGRSTPNSPLAQLALLKSAISELEMTHRSAALGAVRCHANTLHLLCEMQERELKRLRREQFQEAQQHIATRRLLIEKIQTHQRELKKLNDDNSRILRQRLQKDLEREKTRRGKRRRDLADRKMVAQVGFITESAALPGKANRAFDSISNTTSSVGEVVDQAKEMFNMLKVFISKISSVFTFSNSINLLAVCVDLYNLYRCVRAGDKLGSLVNLMSLCFVLSISYDELCSSLHDVFTNLEEVPEKKEELKAQAFSFDMVANADWKWVVSGLMTLITVAIRGSSVDYRSIMTHLSDFGRAAIGFTKLQDLVQWFLDFFRNQKNMFLYGKSSDEIELEEKYPLIEDLFTALHLLDRMDLKYLDRDKELCKLVLEVCEKLESYRVVATRAGDKKTSALLALHAGKMTKYLDNAINSPAHVVGNRILPTTIYMYGNPGVGKSILSTYLESKLYKAFLEADKVASNDYVFTRSCENEYWDGYHNQPILKYDDILQAKDSIANPNPEIFEIIRIVNEAPFHLHMASVNEKKNVYFDSKFVLANSNTKVPDPISISKPGAFLRRWHIAAEVRVHPDFGRRVFNTKGQLPYMMIDQGKVAEYRRKHGMGPHDFVEGIYQVDLYDIKTGHTTRADLTLSQFWDLIVEKHREIESTSHGLRASIEQQVGLAPAAVLDKLNELKDQLSTLMASPSERAAKAAEVGQTLYTSVVESASEQDRSYIPSFHKIKEEVTKKVSAATTAISERVALALTRVDDECDEFSDCSTENYVAFSSVDSIAESVQTSNSQSSASSYTSGDSSSDSSSDESSSAEEWSSDSERRSSGEESVDSETRAEILYWANEVAKDELVSQWVEGAKEVKERETTISPTWQKAMDGYRKYVLPRLWSVVNAGKSVVKHTLSVGARVLEFILGLFNSTTEKLAETLGVGAEYTYLIKACVFVVTSWLGVYFWRKTRGCPFQSVSTFEKLKSLDSCGCEWCKQFFVGQRIADDTPIGSVAHGYGLLRHLARNDEDPKWKNMLANCNSQVLSSVAAVKAQRLRPESGETRTMRARTRMYAETSSEAKDRIVAKTAIMVNDNMVAQAGDITFLEQHQSITVKNAVSIRSGNSRMNALFVTGRTMMMPNHFLRLVKETFQIQNPYSDVETTIRMADCKVTQLTSSDGKLVDLMMVTLPNTIPSRRDIKNLFATSAAIGKLREGELCLSGFRSVYDRLSLWSFHTDEFRQCTEERAYHTDTGVKCRAHLSLWYNVSTKAGDCGAIAYAKNPQIIGKIVGMHVAGNGGKGMSVTISKEFVQRNLDAHVKAHSLDIRAVVNAAIPFTAEVFTDKVATKDVVPGETLAQEGDCLTLGTLPVPHKSIYTQIKKSLIHGTFPVTMAPSHLTPVVVGGVLVDPMIKGIRKVLGVQDPIDNDLLEIAVNDVAQVHKSAERRDILTYEEAIVGKGGYITPINRRTSPGYPYNLNNPSQGKKYWFGSDDEYIINEEIREDVEDLIEDCRSGIRGDVVYIATLKDERRTLAKVAEGKTRVFEAAPMHYVLAVRMYFMSFIASVMENKIKNEVSVGVDPFSLDWTEVAHSLSEKGPNVFAGDFSNFDGSLQQGVLWKICDIINDWYNDGAENRKIRCMLWEEVCNSRVLVNGELIQQTHSQPSGNPLTVIINSMYNQIVMRMAYLYCKKTAGLPMTCDFRENVSLQCYGDDNVLNVSRATPWYNQITVTPALAKVGMTYTDEAKTGQLVRYRTLSEVAYLKRRFVKGEQRYWAPLELSVVTEMTNWIHGNEKVFATEENVKSSLRELAQHGPRVYKELAAQLQEACEKHKLEVRFPTWTEFESEFLQEMYAQSGPCWLFSMRVHEGVGKPYCDVCSIVTKTWKHMEEHSQISLHKRQSDNRLCFHMADMVAQCDSGVEDLTYSMRRVGLLDRPYCEVCHAWTNTDKDMKLHLTGRVHQKKAAQKAATERIAHSQEKVLAWKRQCVAMYDNLNSTPPPYFDPTKTRTYHPQTTVEVNGVVYQPQQRPVVPPPATESLTSSEDRRMYCRADAPGAFDDVPEPPIVHGDTFTVRLVEYRGERAYRCDLCEVYVTGPDNMEAHIRGKAHTKKQSLKLGRLSATSNRQVRLGSSWEFRIKPLTAKRV